MFQNDVHLEDILTDKVVEEDLVEVPLADTIFRVVFLGAVVLVLAVVVQLVRVGLLQHEMYVARAIANMSDVKINPAPRGIVYDRFGVPIAQNEPSFKLFIIPHLLPSKTDEQLRVVELVAELSGLDAEDLLRKMRAQDWGTDDRFFVTSDLSQNQIVELSAADLPGIALESAFQRSYQNPYAFAHVIGYTGLVNRDDLEENPGLSTHDEIGRAGLELFYDRYLHGKNGEEVVVRDARGNVAAKHIRSVPEAGANITTFLDAGLQEYFYERLSRALHELGRDAAVGIALDPRNGEVLSLINIPSFDPIHVERSLNQPHQPFFNRALGGVYNPGSTIKPLVGTAALVEGVIDPTKQIFSAGYIEIPNPYHPETPSRFLDWKPHGWVDIRGALARSSDVYFYEVGGGFEGQRGLGIEALKRWWGKFNLGEVSGIDSFEERKGFLPDPAWKKETTGEPWRIGDTYNVSIGQGDLSVTPLGLLNYITAIANGGVIYKPRIGNAVIGENGTRLTENPPGIVKDFRSEIGTMVGNIQDGMRDVVRQPYGSAYMMHDLPMPVAGKTGTAQIQNNEKTNAFFVGYAPFDSPQIAILVLVENSREGSLNTLPVAKDVFSWYYENRIKNARRK